MPSRDVAAGVWETMRKLQKSRVRIRQGPQRTGPVPKPPKTACAAVNQLLVKRSRTVAAPTPRRVDNRVDRRSAARRAPSRGPDVARAVPVSESTAASAGWRLEPHCCIECFGRILSQPAATTGVGRQSLTRYRCSECGAEKAGTSAAVVCACGFQFNGRHHLRLKCQPNANKSTFHPAEYVATQV